MRKISIYIIYGFLSLFIWTGCNTEKARKFEWDKETAQLTGKDLGTWLRRSPFSNEFDQEEGIDNAAQVFPFMGRYKNAVEELENSYNDPDNPFYQEETVLYQDPDWGDLFVHAALLYDEQEVFLEDHYSQGGNIAFEGANAAMATHSATLSETAIFARRPGYKTGLYWARTSGKDYLLGFCQKKKLAFQVAIPLQESDTLATLSQLKTVNETLALHIDEWENATAQQLKPAYTRDTFWKDPFKGIYMERNYMLPRVRLKIRDTPFREAQKALKGDHYFSYEAPDGPVSLYTELKQTDLDKPGFNKAQKQLKAYEKRKQVVFYEETPAEGQVTGVAKTYFKKGKYLEIHFTYPQTDREAKTHIHGILKNIKISSIL